MNRFDTKIRYIYATIAIIMAATYVTIVGYGVWAALDYLTDIMMRGWGI
jgi:hypothetical protein